MFSLFRQGLKKISDSFREAFRSLADRPDAESLEALRARLLEADLGPHATEALLTELASGAQKSRDLAQIAREVLTAGLEGIEKPLTLPSSLQTILVLGVNGAGKTTTVAKLAHFFKAAGRKVLIGSVDTFRAAANQQLSLWATRVGVELVESRTGADPAAVAFDALQAAQSRGSDLLLLDTAGRLHTKESLVAELQKISRVLKKLDPSAPQERWLVLDGNSGLNNLVQARAFAQAVALTGLIVTKLDGSARAGSLVPLYEELRLPVYFVGLGEGLEDLRPFHLADYLDGLFA